MDIHMRAQILQDVVLTELHGMLLEEKNDHIIRDLTRRFGLLTDDELLAKYKEQDGPEDGVYKY